MLPSSLAGAAAARDSRRAGRRGPAGGGRPPTRPLAVSPLPATRRFAHLGFPTDTGLVQPSAGGRAESLRVANAVGWARSYPPTPAPVHRAAPDPTPLRCVVTFLCERPRVSLRGPARDRVPVLWTRRYAVASHPCPRRHARARQWAGDDSSRFADCGAAAFGAHGSSPYARPSVRDFGRGRIEYALDAGIEREQRPPEPLPCRHRFC